MKRLVTIFGAAGLALGLAVPASAAPNVFWTFGFTYPGEAGTTGAFASTASDRRSPAAMTPLQAAARSFYPDAPVLAVDSYRQSHKLAAFVPDTGSFSLFMLN